MLDQNNIQERYNTKQQYRLDSLPFGFEEEDPTWLDYGYTTVPLGIRKGTNDKFLFGGMTRYKAIFKNGEYQDLVGRAYAVYPHEAIDKIVSELAKDVGFHIKDTNFTHGGKAKYWEVMSERFDNFKIKDSFEKDDEVAVGAVIRNGIGVGIALGADLFTYRLSCLNGAVARGKDIGTISIHHVGAIDVIKTKFVQGLTQIFEQSRKLADYYQQSVYIKINKRIAERFASQLPDKYLPNFIEVDTNKLTGKQEVYLRDNNVDLWRGFNDMTEKLWHSETAGFSTIRSGELFIHRVLVSEVNRKREGNQ